MNNSTLAEVLSMVGDDVIESLMEKDLSVSLEGELKFTEMARAMDKELGRLYRELDNSEYAEDARATKLIQAEIERCMLEYDEWIKVNIEDLSYYDIESKYHSQYMRDKSTSHSSIAYEDGTRSMQAMDDRYRGYIQPKLTIGGNSTLRFTNAKNPREALLTDFDVMSLLNIISGRWTPDGCKWFVKPSGSYLSVSCFLPQYGSDGKRLKRNKKVYFQLLKDMGTFKWNPKREMFYFQVEDTRNSISSAFEEYLDIITSGTEEIAEVSRLEYSDGDLVGLLTSSNTNHSSNNDLYEKAMSKSYGKEYYNHPDNIEGRRKEFMRTLMSTYQPASFL